ncbi:bifunctional riboflavin kinase/FAD synthetase [Paenibacillus sp. TRM 82003]|uniref:bifunctional riboflavin kinase/FAD synthetase n=1 Tax=Kineococcus sp. TRM81007 TaxID=2925831 RepID=UPI001F57E0B3|nr:bifunctional riboflavin kinase/FAD synthetase [Kineococcus sp. TRM81007]MCI2240271.1 bifunctional riboflavin kinase/FAD synthetase [Kineococcus sp. TRM81007]MCI3927551.1 bifunctional riboflavin kinase/FAD synthetase [Paenibacillus sp. TRM 82003]
MQRWDDLADVDPGFGPSVLTVGNFDGVHRGHVAVLERVVRAARERGAAAVAVTFDPHPLQVLVPERAPGLLTGLEHRLELIAACGLDAVLVLPFTRELAAWSPERFVEDVFARALGAVEVVVGHDVRFGRRNSGDLGTLRELGDRHGFAVTAVDDLGDGVGRPPRWSSTAVREALAAGDVERAAAVLGHPHRVSATVVHGDHRGRELGYPTANLSGEDAEGLVPADGVYAGWLHRPSGQRLPAAVSVGSNPTFDGVERRVEAHCVDSPGLDLYGERVAVDFVHRLRPTLRFEGAAALVEQVDRDVQRCRELLGLL